MCRINLNEEFPQFVEDYLKLAEKFGKELDVEKIEMNVDVDDLIKSIDEVSDGEDVNYEVLYKYEGPQPERSFCQRMMRLNKFYTKEEINVMSFRGENKQFGHKRQNYSIWKYKGGVNCKHSWYEYLVVFDDKGNAESAINTGPAPGLPGEVANASNNFWRYPS